MKALLILGPRFQDQEGLYPYYRLQEDGFEVEVVTNNVAGGGLSMIDTVVGDLGISLRVNKMGYELKGRVGNYELLIIGGGAKALEKLRQDRDIINFVREFHGTRKPIGAICHGVQILLSAGVVKGRRIAGYYSIADDVRAHGGIYTDEPAVTDGNLITTAHYKHLGPWMREVLRVWREKRDAEKTG